MAHIPTLLSSLQIKAVEVNTVQLTLAAWQLGDPLPQIQGTRAYLLIMDAARNPRALVTRPAATEPDLSAYTCLWYETRWFGHDTAALAEPGTLMRDQLELALDQYGLMLRDVAAGIEVAASTPELVPLLRTRWRDNYAVARDPVLRYAALAITLWAHRRNPARLLALEEALMPLLPNQDTPASTQRWKALYALHLREDERSSVHWLGDGTVTAPTSAHVRRRLRVVAHLATLQRMVRGFAAVPGTVPGIVDAPFPPATLSGAEAVRQIGAFLPPSDPWATFLRSRSILKKGRVRRDGEAAQRRSPWEMVDGDIEDLAHAFPPCIRAMLAKKEDHLKYDSRFAMACYLSACGVDAAEDFLRIAEPGKLAKDVPSFISAVATAKKAREKYPHGQSCELLTRKGLCVYPGERDKCAAANNIKPTFYNPRFFTILLLQRLHPHKK